MLFHLDRSGANETRSAHRAAGALALAVVLTVGACPTPVLAQSRGELLYSNHCLECHTTQIHWRDKRSATDWLSLNSQVQQWQGVLSLKWSDDEIQDVAAFLNKRFYGFEPIGTTLCNNAPAELPMGALPGVNCKVGTN